MLRKLDKTQSVDSLTDEDILKLMRSEEDNFYAGVLFKRYAVLVFGVIKKYIKDKVLAKDMVMDVFERFLKNPPPQDLISFKNWLLIVARNECLKYLRDKERNDKKFEDFKNFEKKSENFMEFDPVWDHNSREESESRVEIALKQLKPPQQTCLRLFFMEGKSYKEIETMTDFDLNQIKSYLQNGKRKLKMLLEER